MTLLVDAVLVAWCLAVVIAIVRAFNARPRRLAPLPEDVRDRLELGWRRTAARFLYEPQWAVGEADALVMSLLSARGRPLDHASLPREVRQARHDAAVAANGRPRDRTEALRRVLLQYRAAFRKLIGPRARNLLRRPTFD